MLRQLYPTQYAWKKAARLIANRETVEALEAGRDPHEIARGWEARLRQFEQRRDLYLLYR